MGSDSFYRRLGESIRETPEGEELVEVGLERAYLLNVGDYAGLCRFNFMEMNRHFDKALDSLIDKYNSK